jgi:hypothetical protein
VSHSEPPRRERPQLPESDEIDPRRPSPFIILTMGLAMYVIVLWFGITVIGDHVVRSAVMSAVILALIAGWYVTTGRPRRG